MFIGFKLQRSRVEVKGVHKIILSLGLLLPVLLISCGEEEPGPIAVQEVTLSQKELTLHVGELSALTATVSPTDATDKTVSWSTSDVSVASVSDGVVTAKKIGSATITAGAGNKTATCRITVVATPVTSIGLNKTSAELKVNETVTLTATVDPSDATDKAVTWSTSDASVASVSDGVVTAKGIGSATITAVAGNKTATCEITVKVPDGLNVNIEDWEDGGSTGGDAQ